MTKKYMDEVVGLVSKKNGWHFSAQHTSAELLQAFSLEDMAQRLMAQAPLLWDLLGNLLQADPLCERCRTREITQEEVAVTANTISDDDESGYWA
jgi:hypothetical protein